ncbi:hypothetical protein F5X99DRAFT_374684 [Biscogniauxia marginata]|nr:hypothetical protein F5X99DRAFT_374684 [Biscogniauxia marginata]
MRIRGVCTLSVCVCVSVWCAYVCMCVTASGKRRKPAPFLLLLEGSEWKTLEEGLEGLWPSSQGGYSGATGAI